MVNREHRKSAQRRTQSLLVGVALLAALGTCGCKSADQKKCEAGIKDGETLLLSMNMNDEKSVQFTLDGLKATRAICSMAKNMPAVKDIDEAIGNVSKHQERLRSGALGAASSQNHVIDLETLKKSGDPTCPKGQGYQHPVLKELVRCSGPRMVERNWNEILDHFARQKFGVMVKAAQLRGVKNDISYVFSYPEKESKQAPLCLTIDAPKKLKPVELISLVSNIPVETIALDKPLQLDGREVALKVNETEKDWQIVIGDCEGKTSLVERKSTEAETAPSAASAAAAQPNPDEGAQAPTASP